MDPGDRAENGDRSRLLVAFAAGAAVVLVLLGGLFLLTRLTKSHGSAASQKFPFGAAEVVYAQRIHFQNVQMSSAENFLNQEFTYVNGIISNDGVRPLRGLEVTLEFHDPFNQVILRDAQQLITPSMNPLGAGQRRDFQITLEHIPPEWNHEYPAIRVTGLVLE